MEKVSIVGVDISKRVFQLHGSTASGRPVFVKKLSRSGFLPFLEDLPPCLVVMEACGGAHHWGRQIIAKGHECRLIPPVYVKPFVKRQKSDANDAAAIVEAAQRPTMRFVAVKPEAAQADAMLFRTRALFVRQRTQTVNALRGHLAEFGLVSARGVANVEALRAELEKAAEGVPELVRQSAEMLFEQIDALSGRIAELDRGLKRRSREREDIRNLMTIPGIGPVCAMAVHAFAPPMESFRRGRDFAAWTGLTPRQHSTAGRQRLGRITKMGQRDIRSLPVQGAVAVLRHRRGREIADPWLRRMVEEKPFKVAAVALANKMARIIWALSVRSDTYRAGAAS